jgi:hypothetical protein
MDRLKSAIILAICILTLVFLVAACSVERTDPRAVVIAFFRATMGKDYMQLQQLMEIDAVHNSQAWENGSFIIDRTYDKAIRDRWAKGPIAGYTIDEITFEDDLSPNPSPVTRKLAHVRFSAIGRKFVASLTIEPRNGKWYPVPNPTILSHNVSDDIVIWFEEP